MRSSKIIRVPNEYDELVKREMQEIIRQLQLLGIRPREVPKSKVQKLIVDKIKQNEEREKKPFVSLL